MITDDKRVIELRNGEQPPRRVHIDVRCLEVIIPVRSEGGFGQIIYTGTGLHTHDGVEIWTLRELESQ
jgi:hypothetical protein